MQKCPDFEATKPNLAKLMCLSLIVNRLNAITYLAFPCAFDNFSVTQTVGIQVIEHLMNSDNAMKRKSGEIFLTL